MASTSSSDPSHPQADVDFIRRCRIALMSDAELCRDGCSEHRPISRMAWEERADESEAGRICGPREIEAIANLVFGKRRFRR